MEKNRDSKVIAIVALLVAVVGLSLGFAAFSSVLTINASANVKPKEDFNVVFSTVSSSAVNDKVIGEPSSEDVTAGEASINNTSIDGLTAAFTEPGQSVTYSFYAYNSGQYQAFLNSIAFGTKTCTKTAESTADETLVQSACDGIVLKVQVGSDEFTVGQTTVGSTHQPIAVAGAEAVTVTIEYTAGSARADGEFDVTFGPVTLNYSSVGNAS